MDHHHSSNTTSQQRNSLLAECIVFRIGLSNWKFLELMMSPYNPTNPSLIWFHISKTYMKYQIRFEIFVFRIEVSNCFVHLFFTGVTPAWFGHNARTACFWPSALMIVQTQKSSMKAPPSPSKERVVRSRRNMKQWSTSLVTSTPTPLFI